MDRGALEGYRLADHHHQERAPMTDRLSDLEAADAEHRDPPTADQASTTTTTDAGESGAPATASPRGKRAKRSTRRGKKSTRKRTAKSAGDGVEKAKSATEEPRVTKAQLATSLRGTIGALTRIVSRGRRQFTPDELDELAVAWAEPIYPYLDVVGAAAPWMVAAAATWDVTARMLQRPPLEVKEEPAAVDQGAGDDAGEATARGSVALAQ